MLESLKKLLTYFLRGVRGVWGVEDLQLAESHL